MIRTILSRSLTMVTLTVLSLGAADFHWPVRHLESLEYPVLSVLAGESGTIVVLCRINRFGEVKGAEVVENTGPRRQGSLIAKAAVENALKWRFQPPATEEVRDDGSVTLRYIFVLEGVCEDHRCASQFVFDAPDTVHILAQFRRMNG